MFLETQLIISPFCFCPSECQKEKEKKKKEKKGRCVFCLFAFALSCNAKNHERTFVKLRFDKNFWKKAVLALCLAKRKSPSMITIVSLNNAKTAFDSHSSDANLCRVATDEKQLGSSSDSKKEKRKYFMSRDYLRCKMVCQLSSSNQYQTVHSHCE